MFYFLELPLPVFFVPLSRSFLSFSPLRCPSFLPASDDFSRVSKSRIEFSRNFDMVSVLQIFFPEPNGANEINTARPAWYILKLAH